MKYLISIFAIASLVYIIYVLTKEKKQDNNVNETPTTIRPIMPPLSYTGSMGGIF